MTPDRQPYHEGGFTLVEVLVATAITVTLTAAVLALLTPADTIFKVQPEVSDMLQRVRASTDALTADLLMTGAGIDSGEAEDFDFDRFLDGKRRTRTK